jgi:hypothetical protein
MTGNARQVLAEGQSLATDIQGVISGEIAGNAAYFADFLRRREHLTAVDPRFLMMYATSIAIYRTAQTQAWTAEDVEQVINDAGVELVRAMRFLSTSDTDFNDAASEMAQQLGAAYHNVKGNLDRLVELLEQGDQEAIFTFSLMYLNKVHPASQELFLERHTSVLVAIQQNFARLTFEAAGLI